MHTGEKAAISDCRYDTEYAMKEIKNVGGGVLQSRLQMLSRLTAQS